MEGKKIHTGISGNKNDFFHIQKKSIFL